MVLKLTLEFDGTDFQGWQIQPGRRTVQGTLMDALKELTEGHFKLVGASRTDSGVHALNFVASLHLDNATLKPPVNRLKEALNSILPEDIYIKEVEVAPDDFHARYSARSKVYLYRILPYPSPIRRRYGYFYTVGESIESLNEKARLFLGEHDFTHISARSERSGVCRIFESRWEIKGDELHYIVEGDRFLYKMVRSMVGLMLRYSREEIEEILAGKPFTPFMVPGRGLTLMEVRY